MVCNVAVTGMEWSAACLSHPRVNSSGSDLRRPTGRRALTRGARALRLYPHSLDNLKRFESRRALNELAIQPEVGRDRIREANQVVSRCDRRTMAASRIGDVQSLVRNVRNGS